MVKVLSEIETQDGTIDKKKVLSSYFTDIELQDNIQQGENNVECFALEKARDLLRKAMVWFK